MRSKILKYCLTGVWLSISLIAKDLIHPGGILNSQEIKLMRARVAKGAPPWDAAAQQVFNKARLSYTSTPLSYIYIGRGGYHLENGVWSQEEDKVRQHRIMINDGERCVAFTYAYLLTNKITYAEKSIEIMKAWNQKCTKIYSMPNAPNGGEIIKGNEGSNAALELGWMLADLVRSAEILKYTYPRWSASGAEKEVLSFCDRALPHMNYPFEMATWKKPNNWHGTIFEAKMMIAIFKNDEPLFRELCSQFENLMIKQGISSDGLTTDTRRDPWHGQAYLAGLCQCAEIAYHQGINLFGVDNNKILRCMEAHANFGLKHDWSFVPVWEIGYNHYKNRCKLPMPKTEAFINKFSTKARPDDIQFHWGWQFLTHYNTEEASF